MHTHSGQWNTLATYHASQSINSLIPTSLGAPLVVAGNQLLLLSNLVLVTPTTGKSSNSSTTTTTTTGSSSSISTRGNGSSIATAQSSWLQLLAAAGATARVIPSTAASRGVDSIAAGAGGAGGIGGGASWAQGSMSLDPLVQWRLAVAAADEQLQLQQLLLLQQQQVGEGEGVLVTTAQLAGLHSGALPVYHPDVIACLLAKGRLTAAVRLLQQLLWHVKRVAGAAAAVASGTSSSLAAAAGDGDAGGGNVGERGVREGSAAAVLGGGVLGYSGWDVRAVLDSSLLQSQGLQMCQQFKDALVKVATGGSPAAAAAAGASTAGGAAAGGDGGGGTAGNGWQQKQQQQQQKQQQHGLESGMLDMSAFSGVTAGDRTSVTPVPGTPEPVSGARSASQGVSAGSRAAATAGGGGGMLLTGMLDMSSFGMGGFAMGVGGDDDWGEEGKDAGRAPTPPLAAQAAQQRVDMQKGLSAAAAAAAAAPAPSAMESGMLDMSAFGMGGFGMGGGEDDDWGGPSASTPAPALAAAGVGAATGSGSVREGGIAATKAVPASSSSALETGMLDMSAFGMDFGGEEEEHEQRRQQMQQGGAVSASASAGEGGRGGGGSAVAAISATVAAAAAGGGSSGTGTDVSGRAAAAGGRAVEAEPMVSSTAHGVDTGLLHMSAFGLDFIMHSPERGPSPAPAAGAAAVAAGESAEASGTRGSGRDQQQQLETGALDLSAFGMDGGIGDATPAAAAAAVGGSSQTSNGSNSNSNSSSGGVITPAVLASTWAPFPRGVLSSSTTTGTATADGGGGGGGGGGRGGIGSFQTALAAAGLGGSSGIAPATATAPGGAAGAPVLLADEEVVELHELLRVPLPAALATALGQSSGQTGSGKDTAYYSRLLGAAGDADKDGKAVARGADATATATAPAGDKEGKKAKGDPRLLAALGLGYEQVQQLCDIAVALSCKVFSGQGVEWEKEAAAGGGGGGGGGGRALQHSSSSLYRDEPLGGSNGVNSSSSSSSYSTGFLLQLDVPARLLVVNAELAALKWQQQQLEGDKGSSGGGLATSAGAAAAAGGSSDGNPQARFAAAVKRLFQPVSVSRSAGSPLGKGAALLAHYPTAPLRDGTGGTSGGSTRGMSRGARGSSKPGFGLSSSSRGGASGGGGTGSLMRSSMSVASVLSFSSLRDEGDGGGSSREDAAAVARLGSKSWADFVGLLPGVTPLHCLWAMASQSQVRGFVGVRTLTRVVGVVGV